MKGRLTHEQVGAWLLKGNPEKEWDYWAMRRDKPIKSGRVFRTNFSTPKNYRSEQLMLPGDRVVLYMTGRSAGVVEIGLLNDDPAVEDIWDTAYVVNGAQLGRTKYLVSYDALRLDPPVPLARLLEVPALAQAEFRRSPMTSPSYLTPQETTALSRLLDSRDLRQAGW